MPAPRKDRENLGRWRVQQERAQIDAGEYPPKKSHPVKTIGDLVPGLMKQIGIAPDYWQERLQNDWATLVGPGVARNTRPGPLDAVSLTVFVTNSVWLRELKMVAYKPLLEKLQKKYGADKIRHLKILLDPDSGLRR